MSDPFLTVSAAGLRASGVTLSAAEAVACVLLTGEALRWSADAPDPSRVILRGDGRISVDRDEDAAPPQQVPRVETYARLLHRLLPDGGVAGAHTPGALRLTVARGIGALDAPPFASVEDFRTAITRFVTEAPEEHVVAAVVRWAEVMGSPIDDRLPERRVAGPRVDVLRRMLLEADLERYAVVASASARDAAASRPAPPPEEPESQVERAAPLFGTLDPALDPPVRWRAFAAVAIVAATAGYAGAVAMRDHAPELTPDVFRSARSAPAADDTVSLPLGPTETASATEAVEDRVQENAAAESAAGTIPAGPAGQGARPREWASAEATSGEMRPAAGGSGDVPSPAAGEGDVAAPLHFPRGTDERTVIDAGLVTYSGFRLANVVDGGHHTSNVRLSPDGSRVAFDSDRDGHRAVYVADRDGTGVRRVSGAGPARAPAWAPDGRRIAFLRGEEEDPSVRNLWIKNLDTGEERRITAWRYGRTSPADWFGDGRRLCYAHDGRIYVMDLGSGASRSYDSPVPGQAIGAMAASPEGGRVAFHVVDSGVWMLDLRKGEARQVLDDPTVQQLAWSPTGTSLAYHSRRAGSWTVLVVGR